MATQAALQLWREGKRTCRITPTTEPPPYLVVITDSGHPVSEQRFPEQRDALAYALGELERLLEPADQ